MRMGLILFAAILVFLAWAAKASAQQCSNGRCPVAPSFQPATVGSSGQGTLSADGNVLTYPNGEKLYRGSDGVYRKGATLSGGGDGGICKCCRGECLCCENCPCKKPKPTVPPGGVIPPK